MQHLGIFCTFEKNTELFEITSGIILKINLPLYKGFTLEITNKWWPLTTLNRWPLYRIKIYSKMHRESTKVIVMSRWPLYKGDRYDRFDCHHCAQHHLSSLPVYMSNVILQILSSLCPTSPESHSWFIWVMKSYKYCHH